MFLFRPVGGKNASYVFNGWAAGAAVAGIQALRRGQGGGEPQRLIAPISNRTLGLD